MRSHVAEGLAIREALQLLSALADRSVRIRLGLAVLLVGTGGFIAALAPLALTATVDTLAKTLAAGDVPIGQNVLLLGTGYVLAICAGRLLSDLGPLITGSAEQRLNRNLTSHAFEHILSLPMGLLLGHRGGELVRSIDLVRNGSQVVVAHVVNGIVPVVVEVVTMVVVLASIGQPALLATFVVTAGVLLLIFAMTGRRIARVVDGVSHASVEQHAYVSDGLMHCETLRCFVAERAACQRVDDLGATLEQRWLGLNRLHATSATATTLAFTASLSTSLLFAGHAALQGSLTLGGFVLANIYALQMMRPLEVLGSAVRDVSQCIGFMQPLLDILREPSHQPASATPPSTTCRPGPAPSIVFDDVHFGYQSRNPVLCGLDLEVAAGRTVAIVGASGSGKSSIVRLLLRLYEPHAGRILFDGRRIDAIPAEELRAAIGLVPQDTALLHDTVARNIALGRPRASREEIEEAARGAELHDFIAALPNGFETVVGERGLQLSGGERQRIAIARALLKCPRVLVLDEATSMLDSRTEAAILGNLRALTTARSTIVIAHRLSSVMHADEIVVLDNGKVSEHGSHEELLAANGPYARLWRQQGHDVAQENASTLRAGVGR